MGYWVSDGVFHVTMLAGDFRQCASDFASRCHTVQFVREFKGSKRTRNIPIEHLSHGKRIHTAAAAE